MSLQTKVKYDPRCAILSRNYPYHLEEAVGRALTTFRSNVAWKAAQIAVESHGPRKIYFAPVDGEGWVTHEAVVEEVELYPQPDTDITRRLLDSCSPSTQHEGLWEKDGKINVLTLYTVSNCQKLPVAFPVTALKKFADDKHIDENFHYSYAVVYDIETISQLFADLIEERTKLEMQISRIEREVEGIAKEASRQKKNWPYYYVEKSYIDSLESLLEDFRNSNEKRLDFWDIRNSLTKFGSW